MKSRLCFILCGTLGVSTAQLAVGATIVWTNAAGGNWNNLLNWMPNQVPAETDTAVITNRSAGGGPLTVLLDANRTVAGLVLGAPSDCAEGQELRVNGQTLVLNGPLTVNACGRFLLDSGTLGGGNPQAIITGSVNWMGGRLAGTITIGPEGTLVISSSTHDFPSCILTNNGTVLWTGGRIRGGGSGPNTQVYNYGLWDVQCDQVIDNTFGANGVLFANLGILRKSVGSSTNSTVLEAGVTFVMAGQTEIQRGTIRLEGGGSFAGGSVTPEVGILELAAGYFNIDGTLTSTNLHQIGGGLTGVNRINGGFTWLGGQWDGTLITLTTNSVVRIEGSTHHDLPRCVLTNYGTIVWTAGTLRGGSSGPNTQLYNYGLWNCESDAKFNNVYGPNGVLFSNFGVFRKSGGSSTNETAFEAGVTFSSSGQVEVQTGTLWLGGNGWFTGGAVTGPGIVELSAGSFTINGTTTSTNMHLVGGGLSGYNVFDGGFTWAGGTWNYCIVTIATNALVRISGSGSRDLPNTILTNYGTVVWSGGALRGGSSGPNTQVFNYGVWDSHFDGIFNNAFGGNGVAFYNLGLFRKSVGSTNDDTAFQAGVGFNNLGLLDVQTGRVTLASGFVLGPEGRLNFGISSPSDYGRLTLSGAAVLDGALSANLNHQFQPAAGATFQVLNYGARNGVFSGVQFPDRNAWQTNYGAAAFTLSVLNARPVFDPIPQQTTDELTSFNLPLDSWILHADAGSQVLGFELLSAPQGMTINTNTGLVAWTPAQNQALSTNLVLAKVTDNGSPAMSSTGSFLVVVRDLNMPPVLPAIDNPIVDELKLLIVTNTAMEQDIHATTTGYSLVEAPAGMEISASGIITWTPSQNQSPSTNRVTTIVVNTDPFDPLNPHFTATNTFAAIVREVNIAPVLYTIPPQVAYELLPLSVTNTAFEPNIHSVTGYRLLSAPDGMTIKPDGIIGWVPSHAQSPSTNNVITLATNSNPFDLLNPNLAATNSFVVIVKPRPLLYNGAWLSVGEFRFTFETIPGEYYTLQFSTNLDSWIPLFSLEGTGGPITLIDPNCQQNQKRLYRLKLGL